MPNETTDAAVAALRDTAKALDAEQTRLTKELAEVKDKSKAVAKALSALTGEAPRRRGPGRPRTRS